MQMRNYTIDFLSFLVAFAWIQREILSKIFNIFLLCSIFSYSELVIYIYYVIFKQKAQKQAMI